MSLIVRESAYIGSLVQSKVSPCIIEEVSVKASCPRGESWLYFVNKLMLKTNSLVV